MLDVTIRPDDKLGPVPDHLQHSIYEGTMILYTGAYTGTRDHPDGTSEVATYGEWTGAWYVFVDEETHTAYIRSVRERTTTRVGPVIEIAFETEIHPELKTHPASNPGR